jgi:hypothetical protein
LRLPCLLLPILAIGYLPAAGLKNVNVDNRAMPEESVVMACWRRRHERLKKLLMTSKRLPSSVKTSPR